MATTKSTVLGIRLDHDRRAWVEAEAARRGLSVRGFFEGMIDAARAGETADAAPAVAGSGSRSGAAASGSLGDEYPEASAAGEMPVAAPGEGVNTSYSSPSDSSPWSELRSMTSFPGGVIRGTASLTTALLKGGSRWARRSLERCPLTRLCGGNQV